MRQLGGRRAVGDLLTAVPCVFISGLSFEEVEYQPGDAAVDRNVTAGWTPFISTSRRDGPAARIA